MNDNIRTYNEGTSNYSKHKFQCWDFWIKFKLNPFDADLLKRTLRTKSTDPRILDYKKMRHICLERIRQIENEENVFPLNNEYVDNALFNEMIKDYNLISDDYILTKKILYPTRCRIDDYMKIISLCDKRINELEK